MKANDLPIAQVQTEYFALTGGLDLVSPALTIVPGRLTDCQNYEQYVDGGYRRIFGYERLDGRPKPSDAVYYLGTATIIGALAVGNIIAGLTSGATGVIIAFGNGQIAYTMLTGSFVAESVQIAAVTVATFTKVPALNGASDPFVSATYTYLAAEQYRALIQKVPGSGQVRGVWIYAGNYYAFRDNVGATACVMYKATAGGWSAISMLYEVSFTAGSVAPVEGGVITQGGVTATLKRLVLQTGTFGGGTAAGRLIVAAPAGGNFAAGAFTGGITGTCSGAAVQIALAPGGAYEFVNFNFTGSASTQRMYGCDGVNRGFEFDSTGDIYVPIVTGMTVDKPNHVSCHKALLFFAFFGSLQNSGVGTPYIWTIATGAAEIGTGDNITALLPQRSNLTSGAMVVGTRNTLFILYGNTLADFVLAPFSPNSGCLTSTAQNMGFAYYMDDAGIVNLQSTQKFGGFEDSMLTPFIRPLVIKKRGLATASCVVLSQNQYRVFFSDNTAIALSMNDDQVAGVTPLNYGRVVRCAASGKDVNGAEIILFGSDDGYVYQDQKGTSFDGADIEAWGRLPFNHFKSPRQRKHFRKSVFEVQADLASTIQVQADFSDGDGDSATMPISSLPVSGGGAYWDTANWNQFYWSSPVISSAEADTNGDGRNMSLLIYSKDHVAPPHVLQGVTVHFTPRRLQR